MKNLNELNLRELNQEELHNTCGGSEFSESVFRSIGWAIGGLMAAGESFLNYQTMIAEKGYNTRQ